MSASIHPTAIVDPACELGTDVVIGPYCILGPAVTVGDGCWLQHQVTLLGPSVIGPRNRFYAGAMIGQQSQDLKYRGEPTHLEIGEGNTFREFATVHRATAPGDTTRVGSFGNFLAYTHIAHDCIVGDRVIFSNNGTLAGHVTVEDGAIIGGLTAIHQFCRIGRHAITGGCSKIVQDVPPFMIADGNPAEVRGVNQVGLERAGFGAEAIRVLREAWKILWKSGLNTSQALERVRADLPQLPEIQHLLAFFEQSKRGVIR